MKLTLSYPWRYAVTVLLCAGILAARTPDLFVAHNLAFEDGVIFFADAFNRTPLAAILTPYAGYWHLVPRLVAEVGAFLPLSVVPQFYAFCALVLGSVAISWFYLPHFRPIVGHDDLRLVFVLLVVLLPGLDAPLWIAYSQWLIALWGALLVLMTPPRRLWMQWALALAYIAALATAPALFVLFPLWVARMVKAPNQSQRLWMAAILAATLLIFVATLQAQMSEPGQTGDWPLLITDMTRGTVFRLFVSPFIGYVLANEIVRTMDWSVIYGLALVVAVLLALAVATAAKGDTNGSKRMAYLAVAYIAASTSALYLRRAQFYGYLFSSDEGAPLHSLRYHFLGICAIFLLCLMALDHFVTERRIRRSSVWVGVLIVLLLYSPDFPIAHWLRDRSWPQVAHLLTSRIDPASPDAITWSPSYPPPSRTEPGSAEPVVVPLRIRILPAGWSMVLNLSPDSPQGYRFPEGPRLLSIDSHVSGDQLQMDLYWQTPSAQGYTAYVHLLDKQGARINGADVKLEPPLNPYEPDLVWSTQHVFPLSPDMEEGSYDVAVGLYTTQQDQLVPGSAVIVRNQVQIGPQP